MINKTELTELLNAFGWSEVVSKNPHMYSFTKDDARMNIYFTTGTITIQKPSAKDGFISYKRIDCLDKLEVIL